MTSMNFDCDLVPSPHRLPEQVSRRRGRRQLRCRGDESGADEETRKNRYRPAVLVNDWFERRAEYTPPPPEWITVYASTYTCKRNADLPEIREAFRGNKIQGEGLGSELLIEYPGKTFHDNYTTTNDLFFRVLPRGLCGPQKRKYSSRKDLWLPQVNLVENYGNLTQYGSTETIKCENRAEPTQSPREPTQKSDYKRPKLSDLTSVKRFPRPQGELDEPYLCHLDIDAHRPFRPHLIKTNT